MSDQFLNKGPLGSMQASRLKRSIRNRLKRLFQQKPKQLPTVTFIDARIWCNKSAPVVRVVDNTLRVDLGAFDSGTLTVTFPDGVGSITLPPELDIDAHEQAAVYWGTSWVDL